LCLIVALQILVPAFAETVYFHIVAQPMPVALALFAEQAHMQVLYDYEAVASVRCNAVTGQMGKREALERLLLDTGLEATFSSPTAVTVRRVRASRVQPTPSPSRVTGH
jgi:heme acquisition protein HasR